MAVPTAVTPPVPSEEPPAVPAAAERFLLVKSGAAILGVRLESVLEVLTSQPLTPLPGSPESILGLVNLRGRMLTVVDLSLCLGEVEVGHRLVVVEYRGRQVALAVPDVSRILSVPADALHPIRDALPFFSHGAEWEGVMFRAVDTDTLLQPLFG